MSGKIRLLEIGDNYGPLARDVLYSASQLKVVLNRKNNGNLDPGHSSLKLSRYPRRCHPPTSAKKKEIMPQHKRNNIVTAPAAVLEKTNCDHPSPINCNNIKPKETHTTCYNLMQSKLVLTRIKPEVIQSSKQSKSLQEYHSPVSLPANEKETESVEKMKKIANINGHDLSSSKDEDHGKVDTKRRRAVRISSLESSDSSSKESNSSCEIHKPENGLPPETVEIGIRNKILDPLSSHSSPDHRKQLETHPQPLVQKTETSPPLRREKRAVRLVAQKKINYRMSSSEDEDAVDVRKRLRARRKEDTVDVRKRLRARRKSPVQIIRTDAPPRREKSAVRLVAQKKINYRIPSSEDDSSDEYQQERRRRTVRRGSSGEECSFSDNSSYSSGRSYRKGNYRKKQETEASLKKAAVEPKTLSEYEQKRLKNIEEKLAFLQALKDSEVFDG